MGERNERAVYVQDHDDDDEPWNQRWEKKEETRKDDWQRKWSGIHRFVAFCGVGELLEMRIDGMNLKDRQC